MKTLRVGVAAAAALAMLMTGCATNETAAPANTGSTTTGSASSAPAAPALKGTLQGIGASSVKAAQDAWTAKFQTANPDVVINYSPDGSGSGRTAFTNGGADFAGSDRAFKDDEMGAGKFAGCTDTSNALNLPVYISPIAIIFNVDGVESLNMDADTNAKVFSGKITKWNDPAIAALNSGVTLPDADIVPVHRSDNSGTTENFTDTLSKNAPDVWTEKASGDWPASFAGEAAKGTSGVVAAVKSGQNTIGYADESQIQGANTIKYGKDGTFVGPTADAAAQIVGASKKVDGRAEHDWALNLDRTAAGYPFVLVAYFMACEDYKDDAKGELVKEYLTYVVSDQGQKDAQAAAGSAPLAADMAADVAAAVDSIK